MGRRIPFYHKKLVKSFYCFLLCVLLLVLASYISETVDIPASGTRELMGFRQWSDVTPPYPIQPCVVCICVHANNSYRLERQNEARILVCSAKKQLSGVMSQFKLDNGTATFQRVFNETITVQEKTTHIAFLKVHKAGSTTMQNMFFRFGLKHKLSIIIPKRGNYLDKKADALVPGKNNHFDIFSIHTIYNKKLFESLLPKDSVRIAIVREPLARMVSAAYYYRDVFGVQYLAKIPRDNFIKNLVNYPEKYESLRHFTHTRDTMGEDFGFPSSIKQHDYSRIHAHLAQLDKDFTLVLVMERFDESLVLMRRRLNWSIADIVYRSSNSHTHTSTNLTQSEQIKFRSTCFLDYAIYEYFTKQFEQKLSEVGDDFQREVVFFKAVVEKVSTFCNGEFGEGVTLTVEASDWDAEFSISRGDCKWMATEEIRFLHELRMMNPPLIAE